jgi:hypothetical protein
VTFRFRRDLSRRVRWCLLESEDFSDVAFVSFIDAEPARFVAKGRGPSGEWWRLAAWRGEQMEPCVRLRTGADGELSSRPCFGELADQEATLSVEYAVRGDRFVYGAVGRSATAVRVRLADGSIELAELHSRPRGSRARAAYFVLALPREGPAPAGVRAVDAAGRTVGREPIEHFEDG